MDVQLIFVNGPAQLVLERHFTLERVPNARVEQLEVDLLKLRLVHCQIGVLHKRFEAISMLGERLIPMLAFK